MRKRGAAPALLANSALQSLIMLFRNVRPSNRYTPMLKDLCQIYSQYNLAIAKYVMFLDSE
jgi:hypothetical protein